LFFVFYALIYYRYLVLLPVVLAAKWGWFATPVTALIAFVLMGVEAAACEVNGAGLQPL
jgi:predicted membrane chloride channel (bestrophin family)